MKEINYIEKWIEKVSEIKPELNGFAICPYAKNSKYKIIKSSIFNICPDTEYDVIIFIVEETLSLSELKNWTEVYNEQYKEWDFFEEHKDHDTYINGIQTNNGIYNLIICQPREKLKKYREQLSKTKYYDNWSEEYLKQILKNDYNILKKEK